MKRDILWVILIILLGVLVYSNIFKDGSLTRSDNPAHLVEASYLKDTLIPKYHWINGWYPYVFSGIPIQMYSHQMGIWLTALFSIIFSLELSQKIVILMSLVGPPIALFLVLRNKFGVLNSLIPILFYYFQINYNRMFLAGMWNSGLGLIFLIIEIYFLDKYKDKITIKGIAIVALLQALIILSHLFVGVSSFILILAASLIYGSKDKRKFLWLLTIPLSLLLTSFYIYPFLETGGWLNEGFGWGLGDSITEAIYKLIGIFLGLQPNIEFLNAEDKVLEFFKGLLFNLPTIIVDCLALIGVISYLRNKKEKNNFINLTLLFGLFMLIMGSGFWFLTGWGTKIPFLNGIASYKFLYYARISIYILATYYLSRIKLKQLDKILIGTTILVFLSYNIYSPTEFDTETFSNTEIKNETEELWEWIDNNIEEGSSIIDPVTFNAEHKGISSQSMILALTPLYTKVSMISTWVATYYPIEQYLSSDHLRIFNKPRKESSIEEIKNKMKEYNIKYLLTIDDEMEDKLSGDKELRIKKEFKRYSIYELTNYEQSILAPKIKHKILKQTEQELILETEISKEELVTIKIAHHPYWKAYINEKEAELKQKENALMELVVPEGKNRIKLIYDPINKTSIIISIITLITVILFIFKSDPFKK